MVNKDATFDDALFRTDVPVFTQDGRWFITFGQAGFNSPANNRDGYATEALALAAIHRYAARRTR